MSANYSSSRRGPRSQGGRRPRSSSGSPRKSFRPAPSAPVKPPAVGFFQKLLSLIGLSNKKPVKKHFPKSERPESSSATNRERQPLKPRLSRRPERVEVTSPRLYLGNLSFDATESDLFELFSGIGQVQNVELVANRETHRSKGFGFIQMTTLDEAKRAVEELHDKEYMGRKLVVSGAKALPEMRSERTSAAAPSHAEAPHEQESTHDVIHEGHCCNHDSTDTCSL
jgi:RNA recognition motif-containing protein